MIRLQNILEISLQDVLNAPSKRLEDVLKMSWRHFSRRLDDVFKTSWQDVLRRLEDVWPRRIYWSWTRRLEDVFWRRKARASIFVSIKTSWRRILETKMEDVFKASSRRLHQNKCLLGIFIRWRICYCKFKAISVIK